MKLSHHLAQEVRKVKNLKKNDQGSRFRPISAINLSIRFNNKIDRAHTAREASWPPQNPEEYAN